MSTKRKSAAVSAAAAPSEDATFELPPLETNDPEAAARRAFLSEQATSAGERWADGWREELIKEGRAVAGGWPGTLPEARARVMAHFLPEISKRRMSALTREEIELATRLTYASAKRAWLARATPDD